MGTTCRFVPAARLFAEVSGVGRADENNAGLEQNSLRAGAHVGCGRSNRPPTEGHRGFPAELVDGRRREAMTSDVLSDQTAENERSIGHIPEVEIPRTAPRPPRQATFRRPGCQPSGA